MDRADLWKLATSNTLAPVNGCAGIFISLGSAISGALLGGMIGGALGGAIGGVLGFLLSLASLFLFNLYRAEVRYWRARAEGAEAAAPKERLLRANWSIRELFYHIDPNAHLDDGGKKLWKEVGHLIKTAHANGDLVIWATPMPEDALEEMEFPEDRKPPVRLRTDYWQDADLSYMFFEDTDAARFGEHCKTHGFNRKEESYCDLQVNKDQALSLWPPSKAADEVIGGIAVWKMAAMLAADHGWTAKQAADAIESAASLGSIDVIGREMGGPGMRPLRKLKADVWEDHYMALDFPGHAGIGQTFAKSKKTHLSRHYDLRVYEAEARKIITKDSGLERDRG